MNVVQIVDTVAKINDFISVANDFFWEYIEDNNVEISDKNDKLVLSYGIVAGLTDNKENLLLIDDEGFTSEFPISLVFDMNAVLERAKEVERLSDFNKK